MSSYEIPAGSISRALRDATGFLEKIDDWLPGSAGTWFKILRP